MVQKHVLSLALKGGYLTNLCTTCYFYIPQCDIGRLAHDLQIYRALSNIVRVAKLVDEALGPRRLLKDPLFVVLPQGAAQLVIVHGGSILSGAPEPSQLGRVFDLEYA